MGLGTRSRIAVAATVLCGTALLAPATPAAAAYTECVPDHCDTLVEYFSDATYTYRVGERAGEICGSIEWGEITDYARYFERTC